MNKIFYIGCLVIVACALFHGPNVPPVPVPPVPPVLTDLRACHYKVHNRGFVPDEFLAEIIQWARNAPDEIFSSHDVYDVYDIAQLKLGPFTDLKYRRAAMVNMLMVHAGMESSWKWNEGYDSSKPSSMNTCEAAEAGAFQPSYDSVHNFGGDLIDLFNQHCHNLAGSAGGPDLTTDCEIFQNCSKADHKFAIEYTARLLRHKNGYKHFGPWLNGMNASNLSKACAVAIEGAL